MQIRQRGVSLADAIPIKERNMGNYDMLENLAQVKLWECAYKTYTTGDEVPDIGCTIYYVLLQEGGFIHVHDNVIIRIVSDNHAYKPSDLNLPCYDKWGGLVDNDKALEGRSLFGYHYYHFLKDRSPEDEA